MTSNVFISDISHFIHLFIFVSVSFLIGNVDDLAFFYTEAFPGVTKLKLTAGRVSCPEMQQLQSSFSVVVLDPLHGWCGNA